MTNIEREATLEAVNAARLRIGAEPVMREEAPHLFGN